ncbi:C4-dicarboxylate ABC transporter substrate-binding protein [Prauserella sp. PE36]|uniref:Tripartite tricarboxylate transporter substrate binding protein n=1 Tax=Prauserella endophytica TaxID=1592324 RepID=A0ABY2SAS8_9PSEU|nr:MULTISPECIES: tripartite tricarboxylate transporter substrate binding protein [Prauserella]PXY34536.1 C4-dicarboxylate ABC transporter substrate-binding protein [Prauserella coralliicola]RBM13007.1 C4-dicarboxylate ABC transporter substrate-binding protein [Prauserella sp. PE36]TKG73074.1 tripartite tricarboxylate transporter substrate binding protein [Prauserella endophytica]
MRNPKTWLAVLGAALLVLLVPPLVSSGGDEAGSQIRGLRVMVPNTPGGGYDITARTAVKAIEDNGLNGTTEVFNLPGAGGTVGLGRLVGERGNGKLAMSMGLGVVGSVYTNSSPSSLADTTPIAKLTEEADIIVVGEDSPYQNIRQLLDAWKADPAALPVGGGSSPGGPDHLAPMLTAKAIGLAPKDVRYVSFDGGGELMASVLGGKVAFGVTGIGEARDQIEAGELRALAVTGPERVDGIDAPTLIESGVDVNFTNWRGIVAPPGLSESDRDKLITMFTKLHGTQQWKEALRLNAWDDAFQTGEEFGDFLASETERVESVLKELGLA